MVFWNRHFSLFFCVSAATYIGVDFGVTHSKGTFVVQQDAAVSRALIHFLLFFVTPRNGGVGFLITPVTTQSVIEAFCMLVNLFLSTEFIIKG